MNLKIRKRDGRLVKFNAEKITNAIAKAMMQQAATTNTITQNLDEAADGAEEVTNAIANVALVVRNASEIAVKVQHAAQRLASSAEHLQALINQFRI